jgi:NTE family protein
MNENEQLSLDDYDTLVVSGGSMNGLGILGALQYLKDQNKLEKIQNFVGVSVGSIICYLLIIGYTPIEIMIYLCTNKKIFEKLNKFDFVNAVKGDGAVSFSLIADVLERMTVDKTGKVLLIKDLKNVYGKNFTCITYNASKSKQEVINHETNPDLPCLTALRMSSNIPIIFEPYKFGDSYYVDGGLSNNFPVDIGEELGNRVVAVSVKSPTTIDIEKADIMEYLNKMLLIVLNEATNCKNKYKRKNTDIIEILCGDKAVKIYEFTIDSKMKLDFFSHGYEWTKNFYKS